MLVVPVLDLTVTLLMPSVSACSSLYQTFKVSFDPATCGANARSTSLSLNITLVRGLLLANG